MARWSIARCSRGRSEHSMRGVMPAVGVPDSFPSRQTIAQSSLTRCLHTIFGQDLLHFVRNFGMACATRAQIRSKDVDDGRAEGPFIFPGRAAFHQQPDRAPILLICRPSNRTEVAVFQ